MRTVHFIEIELNLIDLLVFIISHYQDIPAAMIRCSKENCLKFGERVFVEPWHEKG